jgi:hypothetical protein
MDAGTLAWIAEHLALGAAPEAVRDALVSQGVPPEDAAAALAAILADPVLGTARTLAQRLRRREAMLQTLGEVAALDAADTTVPRERGLSSDRFLDEYYARNRPVLLEDACDGWPALERWTLPYLRDVIGDVPVDIAGPDPQSPGELRPGPRVRQSVSFTAYVDGLLDGSADPDQYLIAESGLLATPSAAPLLADFTPDARYLHPVADPATCLMWVGGGTSRTALHYDPLNVLFVQVHGHKRVHLAPPAATGRIGNADTVFADVAQLDDVPAVAPLQVEVGPGEALLVPVGWWHQVAARTPSVTLSLTGFRYPNRFAIAEL